MTSGPPYSPPGGDSPNIPPVVPGNGYVPPESIPTPGGGGAVSSVEGRTGAVDVVIEDLDGLLDALNAKASTAALTTGLNGKASTSDLTTGLAGKANTSHTQAISTVTGLQTALDTAVVKGSLVLNVKDYGAIGDGVVNDTTAIQTAINAANTAGGGTVFFPRGTYAHTGLTFPSATGFITLEGTAPTGSQLLNTHATNASITIAGPGGGVTNRFCQLFNLDINASAVRAGQKAIDMAWTVKWDSNNVRVRNHGIGIAIATIWAGVFRNTHIENCTTGFYSVLASGGGASCPAVIENMTIYNCTTGLWSSDGLVGVTWHGGTIGNCTVGAQLDGFNNTAVSFYGIVFEANVDDVLIGTASSGGKSILFSNCLFLAHANKARSVYFLRGLNVTFDTCYWDQDQVGQTITLAVQLGSSAGTATFINPRFDLVTTHVQTPTGSYQIPGGTSLFTAVGFGATPGISRIGAGVSTIKQMAVAPSVSATPAINVDAVEVFSISGQNIPITSMSSGLTGTPTDGQSLEIRIKDAGTAQAITWGASFTASRGLILPTKTVANSALFCEFHWFAASSIWVLQNTNFRAGLIITAVKTAVYTAVPGDLVPVNAAGGAITVTLPAAPADGTQVAVKKIDSSAFVVSVARAGSDVFDVSGGATSLTLTTQFQTVLLQYSTTGSIWYVAARAATNAVSRDSRGVIYGPNGWPGQLSVSNDAAWDVTALGEPLGDFTTALGTRFVNPDPPDSASGGILNTGIITQVEGNAGSNPTNKLFLDSLLVRLGAKSYSDAALTTYAGATGVELDLAVDGPANSIQHLNGYYVVPILGQALGAGTPVGGTIASLRMIQADSIQTGYIDPAGLTISSAIGIYASRPLKNPVTNLTVASQFSLVAEPGQAFYTDHTKTTAWFGLYDNTQTNVIWMRINASGSLEFAKTDGTTIATLTNTGTLSVATPVSVSDAATKQYADNIMHIARSVAASTLTYTIASGSVTQLNGTVLDTGVTAVVGDKVLIIHAPAATGVGSSNSTQPGNGLYVVTGLAGSNIQVARAPELSGSVMPHGHLFRVTEGGSAPVATQVGRIYGVQTPTSGAAFTWGTTALLIGGDNFVGQNATASYIGGTYRTSRVSSTAFSATPTINVNLTDYYIQTAMSAAMTGVTVSGSPFDGHLLQLRFTDNGTARAITLGSSFVALDFPLPTTTIVGQTTTAIFRYNSTTSKYECVYNNQLPSKIIAFATAGRPSAATMGIGAQYYDTTLSKPAWSDGTVWRDAAGTTV